MTEDVGALFAESAAIMARLRRPGGCPWDREQTPDSIRKYTLEETYEVLDAIERRDWPNLAEELGDLLLQVLFYAEMAEEAGHFTLADVLTGLNRKLVRRHPHVFGVEAAAAAGNRVEELVTVQGDTRSVLLNWQAIKQMEKEARPRDEGYLGGVMRSQSALSEAAKLGSAAARAGFDWPDVQGLLDKVREETEEIAAELGQTQPAGSRRIGEEVGDLLLTVANLARHLKVDAEMTLRDANAKFRRRFEAMEQGSERRLEECTAEELEQAWAAVKDAERGPQQGGQA
jgi:MazG family protein